MPHVEKLEINGAKLLLSFHDIVIFIYQFRIRAGQALPFRLEASSFGVTIRDHSTGYSSGENTGTRK